MPRYITLGILFLLDKFPLRYSCSSSLPIIVLIRVYAELGCALTGSILSKHFSMSASNTQVGPVFLSNKLLIAVIASCVNLLKPTEFGSDIASTAGSIPIWYTAWTAVTILEGIPRGRNYKGFPCLWIFINFWDVDGSFYYFLWLFAILYCFSLIFRTVSY